VAHYEVVPLRLHEGDGRVDGRVMGGMKIIPPVLKPL